jgi:beta propeller repeat protein
MNCAVTIKSEKLRALLMAYGGVKVKRKLFLASLVLIFLILISAVASAEQYLEIGSGSEPAIDDGKVTWTNNDVIHVYDLTTRKETTVNSSAASHPAISGNKLVWHDESSEVPRLTVYDIKNRTRFHITKDVDNSSIPAIYGNRIVWSADSYVYMLDISTSTQTKIAAGNNPDIYSNRVSYDSYSADDTPQIYVHDITTKKATDVSQYGDNMFSHIYGDKVIWSDFHTRLGNIRMYDIATGQHTEVTTGDDKTGYDTGGSTNISDNKIVYLKHNDLANIDSGDLYIYDIDTGKSEQLTSGNTAQTPVISGNVIVWTDSGSIYMLNY